MITDTFLANLPTQAGVYKMLDAAGKIIYVGKAKNLKARVSQYFQQSHASPKTTVLVSRIATIEIILTHTENEALLLEQTLIKEHRPRYNVVLRDDKSYPYLYLTPHTFPALRFTRNRKKQAKGRYFGPYSKPGAVKETLELLQQFFKLRNCQDSTFANRSRPCLQYQIGRCKAPCVQKVSSEEYAEDIAQTVLFLEGKNQQVLTHLTERMQAASTHQQFEKALAYRDTIAALQQIIQKQYVVDADPALNFDLIFAATAPSSVVFQKLWVRHGELTDSQAFLLPLPQDLLLAELLDTFLAQHYLGELEKETSDIPSLIYVNAQSDEQQTLAALLSTKQHRHITIKEPKRGEKKEWLDLARVNALENLAQHQAKLSSHTQRWAELETLLGQSIEQVACFDVSHTLGEATVASCVVFNQEGKDKTAYRRFNIEGITGGDDYAAMRQVLWRYFSSFVVPAKASTQLLNSPPEEGGQAKRDGVVEGQFESSTPPCGHPSSGGELRVLLIDGGKGQLTQAEKILSELAVKDWLLLGIAKGEGRKSGLETIFTSSGGNTLNLHAHPHAFLLLQAVRDEAHRFAITGHRQRRDKKRRTSTLEFIQGIGPSRRAKLLAYFGGLQGLKEATVEQIAKVPGISLEIARKVREAFQNLTIS